MITLGACGDGSRGPRDDDESPATSDAAVDAAAGDGGAIVRSDGGNLDAASDAAGGAMNGDAAGSDAASSLEDGAATAPEGGSVEDAGVADASASDSATVEGDAGDGGSTTPDSAVGQPEPDASSGNQSDASAPSDAAAVDAATEDASTSSDAGATDAAPPDAAESDAAADAGAGDASTCQVQDFRFGCGVVRGRFIEFTSGYTIDTQERLVWGPIRTPLGDNDHDEGCGTPEFAMVDTFVFPSIDQARTLSAGCVDTSCNLSTSCIGTSCAADCQACTAGQGGGSGGGYCHPELLSCVDLFTNDACDIGPSADCNPHQHWYYEAATGVFKLVGGDQRVSGRCVARIRGPLPTP